MENEQWKIIPEYPRYQASSFGRIKGPRGITEGSINVHGYMRTNITPGQGIMKRQTKNPQKSKEERVHRLVAMAFLPRKANQDTVNHIDGDKRNNALANLEWCSLLENLQHNFTHLGRQPFDTYDPFLTPDMVRDIRKKSSEGVTCYRIANDMGRKYSTIYAVIKGRTWKHVT